MTLFPEGTVVFAKSGMSCMTGNVYVLPEPCYVVSHLACVIPVGDYAVYLKHYFRSNRPSKLVENPSFPSIRLSKIQNMELEIPVRSEMEKQVRSLEHIESLIEWSKEQIAMLDTLVKSRFVEMFRDPVSNEMGWPASTIKETAIIYGDGPFGSNLKSSDYVDEGVRVIRLGNIQQGYFSEKDQSFVSYEKYEQLNRYKCSPGEIVIATLGSPILRACLVPDSCDPSIHKADCMYYEVDRDRLVPTFAMCVINHPSMLRRAAADVHGQTRGRINSTQTGALPMILPPLALQQEFASFVAEVDKSRFNLLKAYGSIIALFRVLFP